MFEVNQTIRQHVTNINFKSYCSNQKPLLHHVVPFAKKNITDFKAVSSVYNCEMQADVLDILQIYLTVPGGSNLLNIGMDFISKKNLFNIKHR